MTNLAIHFSSAETDWETPDELFQLLNKEFKFGLDVCASAKNAKCKTFISPKQDIFKTPWSAKVCWMNPPYGDAEQPCKTPHDLCTKVKCRPHDKDCKPNCKKHRGHHITKYIPGIADFLREAKKWADTKNKTVVCLVPARPDTEYWHDIIQYADEIRFLRGRVTFGKTTKDCAPFPSAIIVFDGRRRSKKPIIKHWDWKAELQSKKRAA